MRYDIIEEDNDHVDVAADYFILSEVFRGMWPFSEGLSEKCLWKKTTTTKILFIISNDIHV